MTSPPHQTDPESPAETRGAATARAPRRAGRLAPRAGLILVVVLLLAAMLATLLYLNRRAAARSFLTGWLEDRGAPAEVEIERLEFDGVTARLRIGDPRNPDVVVERVQVDYAIGLPWSRQGLGLRPSRVRVLRPVVRATWKDGKVSLGSLDPILREFTGRPPQPDGRGPIVEIEDGRLVLTGLSGDRVEGLTVRGDARLNDGKLMRLRADIPSTSLDLPASGGGRISAEQVAARLVLNTAGDRVTLRLEASAAAVRLPDAGGREAAATQGEDLTVSLQGNLPYPDLIRRRGDGRAAINGRLTAGRLQVGQTRLAGTSLDTDFDGAVSGWLETFSVEGRGRVQGVAQAVDGPGQAARGLRIEMSSSAAGVKRDEQGLAWRANGPLRATAVSADLGELKLTGVSATSSGLEIGGLGGALEAVGPLNWRADRVRFGELDLRFAQGRADLDLMQDGALLLRAETSLAAPRGAWPLLGAATPDDGPDLAEMKRAFSDFAVDLPRLRLLVGSAGTEVVLAAPATVRPRNGGVLTVRPAAQALYAAPTGALGGGALSLVAAPGRGLPEATIDIPDWRLTSEGFEARLNGEAALDFDVARDLTVTGGGVLALRNGMTTFAIDGCPRFAVERLELGENDAEDVSGRLCATGGPVVQLTEGGWRVDGALQDVAGSLPFLQARFADAAGPLAVRGGPDRLDMDVRVTTARLDDDAEPRRFHPLAAQGSARLSNDVWTGDFSLSSGDRPVARVTLRHDGPSERGGLTFDTGEVVFDPQGLQPHDLTPLTVAVVRSPVSGSVRFAGRFDWDPALPDGGASSGRLTVPGLDFDSPAGPVQGLSGTVDFTSLAPLTTAEGQTLRVAQLQTVTPLTDLGLTFTLGQAALRVEGGRIQAAGGALRLEPLSVPLDGKQPFDGVIALDRVQLGELIAGAGFGEKVALDAVVSGRLPFRWDPEAGVTIQGGVLTADQAGRLSIGREALSGLAAGGGGADIPPGTVEDLAYQAMENLAFSDLSAEVNSLDGGRVGVLFRIKGRHDPPQRQELRLSLAELISRRFLERRLPLPSDTGIDLTLDTSLNLNELIQDLLAAQRASRPEPQP
ncbi:intermembrane phospholipid transport protein YdbH family protein [Brevundimonas sp. VNH65]|uniref:intermembrane phospholipid transport protein YdbH family protein n=1 Tax=Brevundimonas sp. VNH65 TaxID=3400917 RepID=UPI003C101372